MYHVVVDDCENNPKEDDLPTPMITLSVSIRSHF